MKKLGTAMLVLLLTACGGGGDTSSSGGSGTSVSAAPADTESPGSTEAAGSGSSSGSISSSDSGPDGTYKGQLTATLSGEGVLPVTDSADLVIEISGSKVTAISAGRSYEGEVDGDSFVVEIPIKEDSKGIVCSGNPVLKGEIDGDMVSGTVSGEGDCSSETKKVPVSVKGEFSARK
ncbi:hypothetical protein N9H39_03040 [Gammaproteobacteria bacterium]|nr:hypothetical protein [Gammaproteobacteria bacterium]